MEIKIRNERPDDHRHVEEITRDAFWNLYIPGCDEHFLVHKMRHHPDFIPELGFVIEADGEVVGSIFYTHSKVVSKDNEEHKVLTFGPVSIKPSMHRKGLGFKLISYSIKVAKDLGYDAILILGYPYHYEPYGFTGAVNYNISMADGNYYKGLMALPLGENALKNVSGCVYFSDVFEMSSIDVDEFDKTFAYKEKRVVESQKEYEIASSMLDEKS